jgi:hypothetical protein
VYGVRKGSVYIDLRIEVDGESVEAAAASMQAALMQQFESNEPGSLRSRLPVIDATFIPALSVQQCNENGWSDVSKEVQENVLIARQHLVVESSSQITQPIPFAPHSVVPKPASISSSSLSKSKMLSLKAVQVCNLTLNFLS